MSKKTKITNLLLILLLSITLITACSAPEAPTLTVPEGVQAGQLVGLKPCTYEANDVEYAADCGILVVLENRTAPNSRLLALPITRVRATGTSPTEHIFVLPGGPGLPNYGTSRISWFIDEHDVVILGYRGVDGSVQLDCPEVSAHIKNLPDRWLGFPVNRGMIRAASFESLSDTQDASKVFDTWLAAAKGDYSGMAMLSLAGPMMFADATVWGENIAKAASADYEMTRELRADMNLAASILGSPRSEMATAAAGWPVNSIPEEYQSVQPSDVETLLVSGCIDLWTPSQFAEDKLLPYLSKGQHVVVAESGHAGMLRRQPEASERLLTSFFDTGEADDSLFTYQPWEYEVGLGFPAIAKIILAVGALIVTFLLIAVRKLVKRLATTRTRSGEKR